MKALINRNLLKSTAKCINPLHNTAMNRFKKNKKITCNETVGGAKY